VRSARKYGTLFAVSLLLDLLADLYTFTFCQEWIALALPLGFILPAMGCYLGIVLIDAHTRRERLLIATIYSVTGGLGTALVLWFVRAQF
jgi:hypothetical protein